MLWDLAQVMIACIPTLSPLVRYYRDQSSNRSTHKLSGAGYAHSRGRSTYHRDMGGNSGIKHSQHSHHTDPGFALDHLGDATRTVINGGGGVARSDLRGMETNNDSEEYIIAKGEGSGGGMGGMGGKEMPGHGGIRADTEVTVEISGVEPRSVY